MIRVALQEDLPLVRSLAERTWPSAYGHIISAAQIHYMLDLMYSDDALAEQFWAGHQFLLYEKEGQPIGFASWSLAPATDLLGPGVYKLNKLYVLPQTQQTGAGKALLHAVIDAVKAVEGQQLVLQVNKANKAKIFYEKQGFTILREMVVELDHGFVMDDYLMGLSW